MTGKEKRIMEILVVVILVLCMALAALCITLVLNDPQEKPDPAELPMQYVEIQVPSADATTPTMLPVVTITIPAPDEIPSTTIRPDGSSTPTMATQSPDVQGMATPTPEAAYVHLPISEPAKTPVPTVPKGMAFTLGILGKTVHVANNVDEYTLEQTPGWLPTSAKPGKEGTCVVYGHRNRNHLLILKDVEKGDDIDIILSDGTAYTYIVDKIEILETDEAMRIPTIEGKHLILMTCYPFYYTGHAPQKYVVTCSLQEGNNA